MFQSICYCNEAEESALMANLQYAKNKKQEKKANFKLLQYYMKEKEYESAITIGDELLNFQLSKKQKYNVYYNLATAYLFSDKPEKALEVGQEAQYLYPKKIDTKLLLGNIYKNNSLNELAIVKYKECLEIDNDNLEALTNLGNVYNSQENYKLSLEYFEKAEKEAVQDNTELSIDDYINMAISAKEIGRRDQAQAILENIKKKNKKSSLLLVSIYQSKQEYDKAIATLKPFVYQKDTDIEIYCNLAQIYLLSGKFNEAKDLLLYFKSRNEKNNEVIDLLLIEAYHNIYQDKERELQELKSIYKYTNLDYIKRILGKVIKFEQAI
ncbi:MAG: tetratricopeptide repeat protein [Elusimicrobia bacterium]|nr:tetratricopeptide repeat protein [Elusimicrobiota bacterium]